MYLLIVLRFVAAGSLSGLFSGFVVSLVFSGVGVLEFVLCGFVVCKFAYLCLALLFLISMVWCSGEFLVFGGSLFWVLLDVLFAYFVW